MILEVADIRIAPGQQAAFDEAIERGLTTVISQAKGFRGWKVNKGVESPERYLLQIFWDTLEDHTVGFRQWAAVRAVARHRRPVLRGAAGGRALHAARQVGLSAPLARRRAPSSSARCSAAATASGNT